VLVIEDDPQLAKLLRTYLQMEDFEVRIAATREEINAALCAQPTPHLVLLDIVLPDIDGFEVLAKMRHHPAEDGQNGARDREFNPRQQIDALVTEYRRDVPKKIEQLQALSSAGHLAELIRELHILAGSAVPSACGSWAGRPAPLRII
jgi:CheY-like chemotaxis protein